MQTCNYFSTVDYQTKETTDSTKNNYYFTEDIDCDDVTSDLINIFNNSKNEKQMKKNFNINDEFELYESISKNNDLNINLFWEIYDSKFNILKKIYHLISSIEISNGGVERLFSVCKHFCHWKKNRIKIKKIKLRILNNEFYNKKTK